MPRWLKWTVIAVAVVVSLLLLSMLVVPWQIKKQSQQWIAENTTRQLVIEHVYYNPFTLKLEINGFVLSEQGSDASFVAFDRLLLSVSGQSLFRRALILDRLEIDAPFVNIELRGEQLFNFSDFVKLARTNVEPEQVSEPGRPFLFSLNNIVLTDGRINFFDQTSKTQARHRIDNLRLSVPFIGNIPYLVAEYVEPHLRMQLNGAELVAEGLLLPFHDSLETRLKLQLHAVDLPFYATHSPFHLPLQVEQGELDLELDLIYRVSHTVQPQLIIGGLLMLTDVDLRQPGGADLLRVSLLLVDLDWANLFRKDINLATVEIYDPQVWIDRDSAGNWNIEKLLGPEKSVPEENDEKAPLIEDDTPLMLTIGTAKLVDGRLLLVDRSVSELVEEQFYPINLRLSDVSNHLNQRTNVVFHLQTQRQAELKLAGHMVLNPVSAEIDFALQQLPLKPYYPYLEPWLTHPISGVANLSGTAAYSEVTDLRLSGLQLLLRDLLVPFSEEDHLTLKELTVSDGAVDLRGQQMQIGDILLAGADLKATRLANGDLSPLLVLRPQPEAEPPPAPSDNQSQWQVDVQQFRLTETKLTLMDKTMAAHPSLVLRDIDLNIGNLQYPTAQLSPYRLSAHMGQRGVIKVGGDLIYTPLSVQAQLDLSAISLADFNDFIPAEHSIILTDGQFYSNLKLNLKEVPDNLSVTFSGDLNVAHFGLRDPLADGDLIRWDSLSVKGLDGDLEPLRIHIREVALSNYLTAVRITPEGEINLTAFGAADEKEEAPVVVVSTPPAEKQPPPDIRIDALTLQGGTVSFTDQHFARTFSTTMYDLGGRVSGLRSSAEMLADVDLRGRLENHSPLTIVGKINPLSEDIYLDLKFSFLDIDLTPMTPYSGTYLGFVIDRGKLNLELDYHIENRKIRAGNQVRLDQFTLGSAVQSDKATSLPVRLAIALLKDRNEQILLNIPVSGDLADPSFSLASTIFTVIRNLLVRAATAPFSLLTAMLGSDKDFSEVVFPPGLARLEAAELEKLEQLTGVLASRPAFNLEISGFVDRDNDPEAYRQEQLRLLLVDAYMRNLQRRGTAPGNRDEVVITDETYPDLLLQVYEQATFPRPRNFIGMLTKLPDEEMEKLLLAHIVVEDQQLERLAQDRALAVRDALAKINEQLGSRLFLRKTDVFAPAASGLASRVELGIIPR